MTAAVLALLTGCGGSDDRPDLAITTQQREQPVATAPTPVETSRTEGLPSTPTFAAPTPLPAEQRDEIRQQAADMDAAIRRWDVELAGCTGPSGDGDDSGATCTHAAWSRLVFQTDVAVYYLLGHLRGMPRGACHDALGAQADTLRGFYNGAAPLDLAWLDERQRPPSLFDLESGVGITRPVPARMRLAVTTACAP